MTTCGYDPFRPPEPDRAEPSRAEPEPAEPDRTEPTQETAPIQPSTDTQEPSEPDDVEPDDLDRLTRTELIDIAKALGVATYGTKAEIADRIRVARADQ